MAAETNRLDALLAAVSDGDAIDWETEITAVADEADVALVRSLELVARIAAAHRSVADDGSQDTTLAPGRRADDETHTSDDGGGAGPAGPAPKRLGHFRILRTIGRGGMGTVYEADDEKMQRRVALKVLSADHSLSDDAVRRFERESWIAGKLDHPSLVKVFERGAWQDVSYYSMELVGGGSLHDVVRNVKESGRDDRMELEFGSRAYVHWAIAQVAAAARALHHAHQLGVIHRDVKPMNLLYSIEQRCVKVTDFGVAADLEVSRMTATGGILGTPSYMAPEQILGRRDQIGPWTDVYALGVTLFELLTLQLPYHGESRELYLNAVLTAEARRPSRLNELVGRDLEIVIRKTLEKAPHDRYATAAALADDLDNVLHIRPIRARPPSLPGRVVRWARRRPIHAALAGTLLVAVPTVAVLSQRAVQHARLAERIEIDKLWQQVSWLGLEKRDEEALEKVSALLARDPGHLLARRTRAVLLMRAVGRAKDPERAHALQEQALGEIAQVLDRAPGLSWPHTLAAIMLSRFGREAEAERERELARASRTDPPGEDDLLFDARLAQDAGHGEEALRLVSELITRRPKSPEALAFRVEVLSDLGRFDKAIEDLRVALALSPDDFHWIYHLGNLYMKRGRLDEAEYEFRRALDLAPDDALLHQDLAYSYIGWGQTAAQAGDAAQAGRHFDEAERMARRALAIDPALAWAQVNLGAVLMEQNRLHGSPDRERAAEAIGHYEAALALGKGQTAGPRAEAYAAALVNTCDAWTQLGELQRALPVCREVTERAPEDPVSFYNLAGVYALLGRSEEAFAALERDVELGDIDWEYLAADRWFEGLRADPRFEGLIDRMKGKAPVTAGGNS